MKSVGFRTYNSHVLNILFTFGANGEADWYIHLQYILTKYWWLSIVAAITPCNNHRHNIKAAIPLQKVAKDDDDREQYTSIVVADSLDTRRQSVTR